MKTKVGRRVSWKKASSNIERIGILERSIHANINRIKQAKANEDTSDLYEANKPMVHTLLTMCPDHKDRSLFLQYR